MMVDGEILVISLLEDAEGLDGHYIKERIKRASGFREIISYGTFPSAIYHKAINA